MSIWDKKYSPNSFSDLKFPDPDWIMKKLAEEEAENKRIEALPCCYCSKKYTGFTSSRFRNSWRLEFSYDENTRNAYHFKCKKRKEEWAKKWLFMWAEIGWHARVDICCNNVIVP